MSNAMELIGDCTRKLAAQSICKHRPYSNGLINEAARTFPDQGAQRCRAVMVAA
jgi:hypothetical protein